MYYDDLARSLRAVPAYQRFLAAFAIGLAASCSVHSADAAPAVRAAIWATPRASATPAPPAAPAAPQHQ
jgi:hypothetical protein